MNLTSSLREKRAVLFFSGFGILVLAALLFSLTHFRKAQASATATESVFRVDRKSFSRRLRLNGTTIATHSFIVLAPKLEGAQVGSMIVTKLAPAGSQVTSGDVLV